MSIRIMLALVVLTFALCSAGCGGVEETPPADPATDTAGGREQLKTMLQSAAESGSLGSGIGIVQNTIEGFRSTDAALADELASDLEELREAESAGQIEHVKEIAGRMAARL